MKGKKLPKVVVRRGGIHGNCVFADEDIKKGGKVIEYVGEKITKAEGIRRIEKIDEAALSEGKVPEYYVFELNKKFDIDGDVDWNPAKYINHSCEPNCESDVKKGKIWIEALRDIKKGEELTYDYSFSFDVDILKETPCFCGSKHCIGQIISRDEWWKYKKYLEKIGENEKARRVEECMKATR